MSGKRVSRRKILSRYCADFFVRASFVYVPDVCEEYLAQEIKALRPPFCLEICSRDFSPSLSINKENWTVRQREREREEQKASGTMKGSLPHFKEI